MVETVETLKLTLGGAAVLTALSASLLAFWSSLQTKPEQSQAQRWFSRKWETLNRSQWLQLPERSILWLVKAKTSVLRGLRNHDWERHFPFLWNFSLISVTLILLITLGFASPAKESLVLDRNLLRRRMLEESIFVAPLLLVTTAWLLWRRKRFMRTGGRDIVPAWAIPVLLMVPLLVLGIIVRAPIPAALIAMLCFTPMLVLLVQRIAASAIAGVDTREPIEGTVIGEPALLFGCTAAASCSLTMCVLFVGHLLHPTAPLPQTLQMLISNVLFDSLTMVTTFSLFERCIAKNSLFGIPTTVSLAVVASGVFACCSLWLAVVSTEFSLSFRQVIWVLVGRSTDGDHWEFGPYFFAMHTTFLPVLACMVIIASSWLGRATLLISELFLRRAQHPDINGIAMTARLLALVAAVFAALAYLVALAK